MAFINAPEYVCSGMISVKATTTPLTTKVVAFTVQNVLRVKNGRWVFQEVHSDLPRPSIGRRV